MKNEKIYWILGILGILIVIIGLVVFGSSYMEKRASSSTYEGLKEIAETQVEQVTYKEAVIKAKTKEEIAEQEVTEQEIREELLSLVKANKNFVGWIQIPDSNISYPMMQGTDDLYYLTHLFDDTENPAGSIFIEAGNSKDLVDYNTIIYGNDNGDSQMFGDLRLYESPAYFVGHPMIYIEQEDGVHEYAIFSCYETKLDSITYTIGFVADETYEEYLETVKGFAFYDTGIEVCAEDQIITLTTCEKNEDGVRFIVQAKKIS